jgi:eukaryotic-like serine/threonine-protein kinase
MIDNESNDSAVPRLALEPGDINDHTTRMQPAFLMDLLPNLADAAVTPVTKQAPEVVDDMIGRQLGGHVIEALIGQGGMGQVYLARNRRMDHKAAVKVLLPEHSRNPRTVDRLFQEAKAAAAVDDPNIIDITGAGEFSDGRCYLVMPFIEGTSLAELCDRKPLMSLEVAATILLQICGGLDAAHRNGIIHRDIKPHNILVGPRQRREHFVKIADFGIAKLLDPHLAGQFRTHTRALMGTPGYMAPEQARGDRMIDARADVYATATVAYRMLTGRRPYEDEVLFALIEKQAINAPFPRPRELRPDIPAEWDHAIMDGLVNNRDKRMATIREFALRLAGGLPNGDQLLQLLVPQLAASPLPPTALTLDRYLDHDVDRRVAAQTGSSKSVGWRGYKSTLQVLGLVMASLLVGGVTGAAWVRSSLQTASPTSPPVIAASPLAVTAPFAPNSDRVPPVVTAPVSPATAAGTLPANAAAVAPLPGLVATAAQDTPTAAAPNSSAAAPTVTPAPAATPESNAPGVLKVVVLPWGAVWVNGKARGDSPATMTLPPGKHRVRISNGHDTKTLDVVVLSSRSVVINETLTAAP